MKEILPKEKEPEPEVTEIDDSASVQKKSRLDTDDDTTTMPDDGKMWSQPLAETRETTRSVGFCLYIQYLFISILEKTNSKNIFKHYSSKLYI